MTLIKKGSQLKYCVGLGVCSFTVISFFPSFCSWLLFWASANPGADWHLWVWVLLQWSIGVCSKNRHVMFGLIWRCVTLSWYFPKPSCGIIFEWALLLSSNRRPRSTLSVMSETCRQVGVPRRPVPHIPSSLLQIGSQGLEGDMRNSIRAMTVLHLQASLWWCQQHLC